MDTATAPGTAAHRWCTSSRSPSRSQATSGDQEPPVAWAIHQETRPHPYSHSGSYAWCNSGYLNQQLVVMLGKNLPLGKALVASDVSPLACFASIPGLGMTLARRTTTWTGHFAEARTRLDTCSYRTITGCDADDNATPSAGELEIETTPKDAVKYIDINRSSLQK